jgi:abortive infection bacteriophage resistance protein
MGEKIFKNLDEQIEILKSKGLIIKDEEYAKDILLRENYFFISGYRHLFTTDAKSKQYAAGSTFNELYGTFLFDRKLRNTMFKYILIVENNIKSILSYQLSRKYGYKEKDYLDERNFNDDPLRDRQVKDVLSKMKRQIRVNSKHHTATMHYMSNYGYIPMWILVKVLSMGIVSEFYSILKFEDQKPINDIYSLDTESFSIYLSILSNYRNLCAHEDILYDYRTQKKIPNNIYHEKLQIPTFEGEYLYGKNDLFAVIIILKKMLCDDEFRELIGEIGYEIDVLDGKVDSVPLNKILNRIGFPDHWREILELE